MIKYQGEDFAFDLELFTNESKTESINIDELEDLVVAIYTDGCKIIRYSKADRSGYKSLTREAATKYSGIVASGDTKILAPGTINMEIKVSFSSNTAQSGNWTVIGTSSLGILKKSVTKQD
jgi:hypothetical protein